MIIVSIPNLVFGVFNAFAMLKSKRNIIRMRIDVIVFREFELQVSENYYSMLINVFSFGKYTLLIFKIPTFT